MTEFTCQQCGKKYQLKSTKKRVFCSCGAVDWNVHAELHKPILSGGSGTELAKLLAEFGIEEKQGCSCKSIAEEMDRNGVQWCINNRDDILARMSENAKRYSWIEKLNAAAKITASGYAAKVIAAGDPLAFFLDTAIERCLQCQ